MHELGYVLKLTNMAIEIANENKAKSVKCVVVEVGKMSGVLSVYMQKYYKDAIKNTILEKSQLVCEEVPVKAHCDECGKDYYPTKDNRYLCTFCNGRKAHIIQGKDVLIKDVVIEE